MASFECRNFPSTICYYSWTPEVPDCILKFNHSRYNANSKPEIMKRFRPSFGILLAAVLILSSCSKEEEPSNPTSDQATLSFNALLNDLVSRQADKQAVQAPACSSGIPAFVEVILSQNDIFVVGTEEEPLRIALNTDAADIDNDGSPDYFTKESSSLELSPGTYMLEYFTVLDADGNIIWISPIDDGAPGGLDEVVENKLPMQIDLGAGVKKYVNVDVVCFDDRIVNLYGYLFFDLNGVEVIEFCIFGNYCDETGRHADFVLYEVDVWKFSGDAFSPKGEILHENLQNSVDIADYEDSSEAFSYPLCVTLPDGPGFDEYYIEISLTDMGTEDILIRSGLISDADVRNLFAEDGSMDFYHFREGNCNLEDNPNLLSDHRDLLDMTWEFTFYSGDALIAADVVFYPNGTASYQLYGNSDETIWGTWAYFDDYLFYDPDGDEEILGFHVSGKYTEGTFSGDYWRNGVKDAWSAHVKD